MWKWFLLWQVEAIPRNETTSTPPEAHIRSATREIVAHVPNACSFSIRSVHWKHLFSKALIVETRFEASN